MIKKILNRVFDNAQNTLDKMYEEEGLTDEILQLQAKINELRNKYDLHGEGWKQ